jgi:hypothetical protein
MMLTAPVFIKRDGDRFRLDGLDGNDVFLHNHQMGWCKLDITLGVIQEIEYHPLVLAMQTKSPDDVLQWIIGMTQDDMKKRLNVYTAYERYEKYQWKLETLDSPWNVVPTKYVPVISAFVTKTPAKEIFQGIKAAHGFEAHDIMINYLNDGYQFATEEHLLEDLVQYLMHLDGLLQSE